MLPRYLPGTAIHHRRHSSRYLTHPNLHHEVSGPYRTTSAGSLRSRTREGLRTSSVPSLSGTTAAIQRGWRSVVPPASRRSSRQDKGLTWKEVELCPRFLRPDTIFLGCTGAVGPFFLRIHPALSLSLRTQLERRLHISLGLASSARLCRGAMG
ncbi:hypothetical protein C8Q79DRAFT_201725 [Trametes meyenii]|nr:hypothetical protein C8Q79DRAFT_201725 [Trametes meyenii]